MLHLHRAIISEHQLIFVAFVLQNNVSMTRKSPKPGPKVIIFFSCSIQLCIKFQLIIKTKTLKKIIFLAFKLSYDVFILRINVKMPTIVGIITFMSRINFVLN